MEENTSESRFTNYINGLLIITAVVLLAYTFISRVTRIDAHSREVLAQYYQAIGGAAELKHLKYMSKKGEFEIRGSKQPQSGTYLMQVVYPNRFKVSLEASGYQQTDLYYKGLGWTFNPRANQYMPVTGKELKAFAIEAQLAGRELIYPQRVFKKVKYAGSNEKGGTRYHALAAINWRGENEKLYFAADSHLLVRWEKTGRIRSYSKYTKVGSFFFPLWINETIEKKYTLFIRIHEIDLTTKPEDDVFRPKDSSQPAGFTPQPVDAPGKN